MRTKGDPPTALADSIERIVRPRVLLLTSLGIWLAIFVITGVRYRFSITPSAWAWLSLAIVALLFGAWVGESGLRGRRDPAPPARAVGAGPGRVIAVATAASAMSVVFRAAAGDRLLPTASALETAQFRDPSSTTGFSLADIGTPLATFGVCAAIALAAASRGQLTRTHKYLAWFCILQYVFMGLARGSRTHLAFIGVAALLAYLLRVGRRRYSARMGFALAGSAVALTAVSFWVLSGRLEAQRFTTSGALIYLQTAHAVELPHWVTTLPPVALIQMAAYTAVSLAHYVLHGMFEFGYLFSWRESVGAPLGWGVDTFSPLPQIIFPIFGLEPVPFADLSPVAGVYQGLFGAFLVDFGPLGMVIAALVLGLVAGRTFAETMRRRGDVGPVLIYVPVAVVVLMAPFFNAIGGVFGVYTFIACLVCASVARRADRVA